VAFLIIDNSPKTEISVVIHSPSWKTKGAILNNLTMHVQMGGMKNKI